MKRVPGGPTPPDLDFRIDDLIRGLPPHSEIARLLRTLGNPASDEASRDRYVGIVAANAVEGALRLLLDVRDPNPPRKRLGFKARIDRARKLGLVAGGEADELDRIRRVRDIFAHALSPIDFGHPTIEDVMDLLWNHPIGSWSEYFLPVFSGRHRFAIVCGAFIQKLRP